jgi:hypothetical protein
MARGKYKAPEVSTQAPVTLEFDDFKLELTGLTERIEERHRKKYGRKIGISGWLTWEGDGWVFAMLSTTLEEVFKPWRVHVNCDQDLRRTEDGDKRRAWVNVVFSMTSAVKPSLIPTDEEAWAMTMAFGDAARKMQLGIERAHKAWSDKNELEDRTRQAEAIRAWARDQLFDGAKEAVCFDEKLAELRREVLDEVQRRVSENGEALLAGLAESDWQAEGSKFHPKAIEVGWKKGVEGALSSASNAGRSGFRRGGSNHIKPEEVT